MLSTTRVNREPRRKQHLQPLSKLREGDEVSVKVFRPATVRGKGNVSTAGEYIDLTVKLAIVDGLAQ